MAASPYWEPSARPGCCVQTGLSGTLMTILEGRCSPCQTSSTRRRWLPGPTDILGWPNFYLPDRSTHSTVVTVWVEDGSDLQTIQARSRIAPPVALSAGPTLQLRRSATQQAVEADSRASSCPAPSYLSPVVKYHRLARLHLTAHGFWMRPLLNSGTLGGRMKSADLRCPFDEALGSFITFLQQNHWPTRFLWLARNRISGHRRHHWLFRPEELTSDMPSRRFYEQVRTTNSSIRIDAFGRMGDHTMVYVQDFGRDSRLLNFGFSTNPFPFTVVRSPSAWTVLRSVNRLRGESPFLSATRITPRADGH
jgi:hypothetical protein